MTAASFGRRFLRLLITIVVGYGLALLLIRVLESHLIFFPNVPDRLGGDWNPRGLSVEDVWLRSADGIKLHAWWIPRQNAKFTFLAFHGNAGNIANRADIYKFLSDTPANVLAIEYRGYGKSEGSPSETGVYLDAEAGYRFLVNGKAIRPEQIISFGQSLGTAVAARLAAQEKVGGVVLEAPFPSASAVARRTFWFLPGLSLLVQKQFNTKNQLAQIKAPILIVHCTQDPVIPFGMGQETYQGARSPKAFLGIDGYCHEEASLVSPGRYRTALLEFLRKLGN
jgi:fermentation-respiration switch protein FrsA (DUF1100 family)